MQTITDRIMSKQTIWKIGLLFFICYLSVSPAQAQPGWVKKATKSVFTVKTFSADGSLIGSTNGFFVGTEGEAISNFAPFKGASRAIAIDATGKEMNISTIMGADEMYDVVKFRVEGGKSQPLTIASSIAPEGSTAWLLPYREMKTIKAADIEWLLDKYQNDGYSDSYPSWSSNSHWIMCASRRDDDNYSRIYFAYFNNGKVEKAFLMPQEDPEHNTFLLKSYNRPEFMVEPVKITVEEFSRAF